MIKIVRSQVLALKELGYGQSCLAIDDMHKREMASRTKELRLVDKTMAQQIASVVGGRLVDFVIDSATFMTLRGCVLTRWFEPQETCKQLLESVMLGAFAFVF